jgi:hypothetical protein
MDLHRDRHMSACHHSKGRNCREGAGRRKAIGDYLNKTNICSAHHRTLPKERFLLLTGGQTFDIDAASFHYRQLLPQGALQAQDFFAAALALTLR